MGATEEDLNDVLTGKPEEETEETTATEETEASTETGETDETSEDESTGDKVTSPPEDETSDDQSGNELENRVKGLERALAEERAKKRGEDPPVKAHEPDPEPEDIPADLWLDDPKRANEINNRNLETRARQLAREEARKLHLANCEYTARKRYPDYQEKLDKFMELAQSAPALMAQVANAPDPHEEAYGIAKQHIEMADVGDPEAYKAKLREEVAKEERAKIEAEMRQQLEGQAGGTPKGLPPSLATARGVSEKSAAGEQDDSLDSVAGVDRRSEKSA